MMSEVPSAAPAATTLNDPAIQAIAARCAALGLRMTGPRLTILSVLARVDDHPDVDEVHRRCLARDHRIAISTVYRTVRLLADAGVVDLHVFADGRTRIDLPAPRHDHLIDTTTGHVVDISNEELTAQVTEIARRLGYRLVSYRLDLYGVPSSERP